MKTIRIALPIACLAALSAVGVAQDNYTAFTGPVGEEWSRLGTDGTDLYFTTNGSELWKYTFPANAPGAGTWTQMATAPRTIDDWDSYRGLAFQGGYLYTSATSGTGFGRTVLRYQISSDTWEIWQSGGTDLDICYTSGNAIFMDPSNPGVGYSAWHAGNYWVTFDWTAQTANNNWLNTGGMLGVSDDQWISRNEDIATDGNNRYYTCTNDWTQGLSDGDCMYYFDLSLGWAANITHIVQKPWQSGAGATLEFIPAGHALNTTGNDELWFWRGGDGAYESQEGWSYFGTQDMGVLDLSTSTWTLHNTPFWQARGTDSVMIGDHIFVKSAGSDTSPTVYDDQFWFVSSEPGLPYCFGNSASGNSCPCGNDNDGTTPLGGCQHDDSNAGAVLAGSGTASITSDTLLLEGSRGPISNSTLFFQANNDLNATGNYLGDGIRCAGGGLIRLKVKTTDASGYADSSPAVITTRSASFGHTIVAGETLYYQWWVRDSNGSPCGNESNTSNGYAVTWLP